MIPTLRRRAGTALAALALVTAGAALTPAAMAAVATTTTTTTTTNTTEAAAGVTYLRALSGDSQTVNAGQQVGQALIVKALDAAFQPVPGATITFSTPGELTFAGAATTATAVTGADGTAQAPA
ncbi:hypothetical protein, partial [Streptomyces sp. NPDC058953]